MLNLPQVGGSPNTWGQELRDWLTSEHGTTGGHKAPMQVRNAAEFSTIQAAINDLPSTGGIVFIPAGTYNVTAAISVPANVTLWGAGTSTILKIPDSTITSTAVNIVANTASGNSGIVIRDLVLDGNRNNQSPTGGGFDSAGINFNPAVNKSKILNCTIRNIIGDAIVLANGCGNNEVRGNSITNIGKNGITQSSQGIGIYIITNCHDNLVAGNEFFDIMGGSVVNLQGGLRTQIVDNRINVGSGNTKGIQLASFGGTTPSNNVVANNEIRDLGDVGIYLNGADRNTVQGNIVSGCTFEGIEINGQGNIIFGNTCSYNHRDAAAAQPANGIALNGDGASGRVGNSIQCNSCFNNDDNGIRIVDDVHGTVVYGNVCFNNAYRSASNGLFDGIQVTTTVAARSGSNISIMGNRCFDNQSTKTQRYGINAAGGIFKSIVLGNVTMDNLTAGIFSGSAGGSMIVKENIS